MKTHLHAIVLATSLTFCPAQEPAQSQVGAVAEVVSGEATVETGGVAAPLTKGQEIREGQTIRTGKGGLVLLKLRNKGELILYESSRIELKSEPEKPKEVRLLQTEGFTWSRLPKLRTSDAFLIETPAATAGIRGTAFSTRVDPGAGTQFCVCEGSITLRSPEGELTLRQGELAHATQGQPMKKPVADLRFLKHPTRKTLQCLECHQGGHNRDGRY